MLENIILVLFQVRNSITQVSNNIAKIGFLEDVHLQRLMTFFEELKA